MSTISDGHVANVAPEFNLDWVGELIRILKVQIDYTDIDQPHDNLIRNAVLQSCLSIMHSIGFRGRLKPQSFCGKLAMINLNVRNANLLITMAINPPPPLREKTNPLDEDGK
jgi:mediator of RNA polymerase II transcription subunit 16